MTQIAINQEKNSVMTSPGKSIYRYVFAVIIIMAGFNTMFAQSRDVKTPSLKTHQFIPISGIHLPNTGTKLGTYIGGGKTVNFTLPLLELENGHVIGLKGDILFVDALINYQQRVRDWLAVYVRYHKAARLGTEVQSVLAQGYNSINSFEIGWKFKLLEYDEFMLSTSIEMQNHSGQFTNILGYVKDLINNHPDPSITEKIPVITGGGGIHMAYGINDLFGVAFVTEVAYGETYTRGENGVRFNSGLAFDVNFKERFSIPVGLAVASYLTSQPELVYVDKSMAKLLVFKLAYTGASDFSLGLEWSVMKSPMPNVENEPMVQMVGLSSRYYF